MGLLLLRDMLLFKLEKMLQFCCYDAFVAILKPFKVRPKHKALEAWLDIDKVVVYVPNLLSCVCLPLHSNHPEDD